MTDRSSTRLSEGEQLRLARSKDKEVRRVLAQQRGLTEEVQERLSRDRDDNVRWFLANNPTLLPRLQLLLSRDEDPSVRDALLDNPGVVFDDAMSLEFLHGTFAGDDHVEASLEGCDPLARAALEPGWDSSLSLADLKRACELLGPSPA